ncbi:GGDEF domain-containing protein [Planctomycetaceae bacterium SH139]
MLTLGHIAMTPTVILIALVCQILFAAIGGLLWFRSGNKVDKSLDIPNFGENHAQATEVSVGLLAKISGLLLSHQGVIADVEAGRGRPLSDKERARSRAITCQLDENIDHLSEVLLPYDDLYSEERSQLKDYAGRAESLDRLLARQNQSPVTEEKLMQLLRKMQQENEELRSTVEKCESEISELIVRAIRSDRDARIDPLTRLPNRRAWIERKATLEPELADYAIATLDLDHFKEANDTLGHAAGDAILRLVAKILRESLHATVYRIGGDEFVLLVNCKSLEEAKRRIELIRERIEKARVYHDGKNLSITATIGVAQAGPTEPIDTTLERADQALYEAKRKGKNRIEASEEGVIASG